MIYNQSKRIIYKYGEAIRIKPIFDVHLGNRQCDVTAFQNYMRKSDDMTWFIGGGDLFDSITIPDKRYQKSADATETDEIIDEQVKMGLDLLTPYKHKILGLGS